VNWPTPPYPRLPITMPAPTCYAIFDFHDDGRLVRIPVHVDPWHPVDGFSFWPGMVAGKGWVHDDFFVGHPRAFAVQIAHNIAAAYRPEGL
jgi:hypothetical protein